MKSLAFALILLLSFFGTNQSVWFSPIQAGMDEMNMLSAVSNLSENNKIIVTLLKSQGEIKNKSLVGIWQICEVAKDSADNYIVTSGNALKIISSDKTFKNLLLSAGSANSTIFMEGNYELPSDSIYVESLTYSATPVFPRGARNEMHVKFLHDNLIQISFDLPGQGRRIDEL